jgi:hypothetical protein
MDSTEVYFNTVTWTSRLSAKLLTVVMTGKNFGAIK